MESVEIIATDKYLPKRCITNKSIEKKFDLSSNWISTRTGINQRFYSDEDISMLAIKAVENLIMNYIILFTTAVVLKIKVNHIRLILASLLGAGYSIIAYMGIIKVYSSIILKIILSVLIIFMISLLIELIRKYTIEKFNIK